MANVDAKKKIVSEISQQVEGAQSVVVVDYRGLKVDEDTKLRRELREGGVVYKVYKNSLMNFAFKGTDFESLTSLLEGPNAIAISKDDATAPARIIEKFAKDCPTIEIKAGVVEGSYYDASGMKEIALIPSRQELLSKLFGSLQSPIVNFARVISQLAEQGGACVKSEEPATEAAEAPAEKEPEAAKALAEAANETAESQEVPAEKEPEAADTPAKEASEADKTEAEASGAEESAE